MGAERRCQPLPGDGAVQAALAVRRRKTPARIAWGGRAPGRLAAVRLLTTRSCPQHVQKSERFDRRGAARVDGFELLGEHRSAESALDPRRLRFPIFRPDRSSFLINYSSVTKFR